MEKGQEQRFGQELVQGLVQELRSELELVQGLVLKFGQELKFESAYTDNYYQSSYNLCLFYRHLPDFHHHCC